jgi:hypothetical protein
MGAALHGLTAAKANITGGAFEALSAIGGDSLSLFSFPTGSRAFLLTQWGYNTANKAEFDTRSPRLHDNVRGIRVATTPLAPGVAAANGAQILLPRFFKQPLYSSDTLIQEVSATATNNSELTSLIYYENMPGVQAQLVTYDEIAARIANIVGIRVAPTSGAVVSFGATVALNSVDDRLQADLYYAVLGYTTDTPFTTFGIKGPDTGNLRIAAPGMVDGLITANWFVDLSKAQNLPTIPVIAANNRGTTVIDCADALGATAPVIDLILAELM